MNQNPYSILGVSKDVTEEELKKKYRELLKKYHPDNEAINNLDKETLTRKSQEISEAYEKIKQDIENRKNFSSNFSSNRGPGNQENWFTNNFYKDEKAWRSKVDSKEVEALKKQEKQLENEIHILENENYKIIDRIMKLSKQLSHMQSTYQNNFHGYDNILNEIMSGIKRKENYNSNVLEKVLFQQKADEKEQTKKQCEQALESLEFVTQYFSHIRLDRESSKEKIEEVNMHLSRFQTSLKMIDGSLYQKWNQFFSDYVKKQAILEEQYHQVKQEYDQCSQKNKTISKNIQEKKDLLSSVRRKVIRNLYGDGSSMDFDFNFDKTFDFNFDEAFDAVYEGFYSSKRAK